MRFNSKAVHAGRSSESDTGAITPNISMATTFLRDEDGGYKSGFQYSRSDNPTRKRLEQALTILEGGSEGFAFGSGMAAISAVFATLSTGDEIILPKDIYYGVRNQAMRYAQQFNIGVSFSDMQSSNEVKKLISNKTKIIFMETPSNPSLDITNIQQIANLTIDQDIITCVDNTWATPVLQNPLKLGVDIVMHSTTKYIGGHSDIIGGALVIKENDIGLGDTFRNLQNLSGGIPSPFDCWLLLRSISTLPLRVQHQSKTAFILAQFLEKHPNVELVNYPGLTSHPDHEVAKRQMSGGFGGMLSFLVKGGEKFARKVANSTLMIKQATSLGGVESLIEHRASVEGPDTPTPNNLIRFSVGLEDVDDLIEDLDQALDI